MRAALHRRGVSRGARRWQQIAKDNVPRGKAKRFANAKGMGAPEYWVHVSVDPKLLRTCEPPPEQAESAEALRVLHASHKVDGAVRRAHYVAAWETAIRKRPGESEQRLAEEIIQAAAREGFTFSYPSLRNWRRQFRREGLAGLVDKRGSSPAAGREARSAEAIEYFMAHYGIQTKPTIAAVHRRTLQKAQREG